MLAAAALVGNDAGIQHRSGFRPVAAVPIPELQGFAGHLRSETDRAVGELQRIADEPVPQAELDKARNVAKGRFVLQVESPHGLIMFGLRREVLENEATEPEEILAALDAVTADDVQRVAQNVIGGNGLNLALIGPFEQDQEERFQQLLAR